MPWLLDQTPPADLRGVAPQADPVPQRPGLAEIAGAAWRQDNIVGSSLAGLPLASARSDAEEPDLDPFEYAAGTPAGLMPSFLARARNRREIDAYNDRVRQEEQDRRTLAAGGAMGILAELVANGTDPTMLIPAGGFVRAGRIGYSALKSAAVVGGANAASQAVQEAGLQATQETRPIEQSVRAISGAAILGALVGGVGAKVLDNLAYNGLADRLAKEAGAAGELPQDFAERIMREHVAGASANPASAGAAVVVRDTLDDLTISGRGAQFAAAPVSGMNPLLRALRSPSAEQRRIMLGLMENPIYLKKNLERTVEGAGPDGVMRSVTLDPRASEAAVETLMKEAHGAYTMALEETEKLFVDARKAGTKFASDEFRDRIGRALRRGDVDEMADPTVSAAAKIWRDKVFDPLKEKAIKAGLLPEDVKVETAMSYFTRVYNKPMIEANEVEFKAVVKSWLGGALEKQVAMIERRARKRADALIREADDLDYGILRRSTNAQARDAGAEVVADAETERAILDALKLVRAGTKRQEPEGLTSYLVRSGGLYDEAKDLEALGISAKTRPGLVKSERRRAQNPRGGMSLDDAALKAWEDGFFPDNIERPTVSEFLDALSDDFNKFRRVVRGADREAAATADLISRVVSDLERIGVDVSSKAPMFSTSEEIKGLVSRITRSLDADAMAKSSRLKVMANDVLRDLGSLPRRGGDKVLEAEFNDYVDEIANSVFDKITGRATDSLPVSIGGVSLATRGPLKERTLSIPDLYKTDDGLSFEKFLVDDVEEVARRYTRVMSADVELTSKYGKATLEDQILAVQKDYERLRAAAAGDAAALDRLRRAERDDIGDMKAVRDMLRGQYLAEQQSTNFARALRVAKAFNAMRAMGGVVLASLTDAARPVFVHGLGRYMNDGIGNLVTNLAGVRLAAREAKLAGVVGDVVNQSRMATLAEITDPYSIASPFERFVDNTSKGFWRLTGMPYWNDFWKSTSSVMTQNRIIEASMDFAKASKRDKEYLAFLNIDRGMASRIIKEFEAHGETVKGVKVANTEDWTDEAARRAYRAALAKDVDSIIVAKGVGDIPLALRTPLGSAMTQFRGFALASYQRATLRGLQEAPLSMVAGMIMSTTIGMFVYWLKSIESNKGSDISDNPGRWIAEGLDRSGLLAIPFEINNTFEKIGGPGVYTGLQALFPSTSQKAPASRYASRNAVDAMLGPTFGAIHDIQQLLTAGIKMDLTPGDVNAIRRLTPGASLPFFRSLIEYEVKPALQEAVK